MDYQLYQLWIAILGTLFTGWTALEQHLALAKKMKGKAAESPAGGSIWSPQVIVMALLALACWMPTILNSRQHGIGTVVDVDRIVPLKPDRTFVPGQPAEFNIFFVNRGPLPNAEDVRLNSALMLVPTPVSTDDEDRRYREFRREPLQGPLDLKMGSPIFHTLSTRPIIDQDIQDINNGRLRLYVLVAITYRDPNGLHETEYCAHFVPEPSGRWNVLARCRGGHNTTR